MIAEKIVSRIDDTRQHCPDVNAAKFDTAVGEILGLATLPDIKSIVFTSTTCIASCEVLIPIDLIEIVRSRCQLCKRTTNKSHRDPERNSSTAIRAEELHQKNCSSLSQQNKT